MANVIIVVILLAIIGLAAGYIIRAKKSGRKCIGCPDGCSCSKQGGKCGCGSCGD